MNGETASATSNDAFEEDDIEQSKTEWVTSLKRNQNATINVAEDPDNERIIFLEDQVNQMERTIDELRKEQAIATEERREQAMSIEELRSFFPNAKSKSDGQKQYLDNVNTRREDTTNGKSMSSRMIMLGRTPSVLFESSEQEISLDEDTFSLMMISRVGSYSWLLGFTAFSFQMTLGIMIVIEQIGETDGTSIFDVPFKVNAPSFRVAQFLSLVLCLSTQSDILTSIRSFFLLGKGTSNWTVIIGEEERRASCGLWIARVGVPNAFKLSQGLVVTFVSFVTIVQNEDTINLLKDFTSLMIISEFDNILFQLAAYGYLGQELRLETEKVTKEFKITTTAAGTKSHNAKRHTQNYVVFVRLAFVTLLSGMFAGWGIILRLQWRGIIFDNEFPGCGKANYGLAYDKFGDGKCYGGPFNTIDCKYENGDCANFNTAYPNCNGDDLQNLYDVENEVGNTKCNITFAIPQCAYDGGDCCPYDIHLSPFFGNGECNGGVFNTEGCQFDFGDCDHFNRMYPNCALDEVSLSEATSTSIVLGNGICEGGGYTAEECGFEFGDCDKAQLGGDILLHGVISPSLTKIDFHAKMSSDGSKILVELTRSNQFGQHDLRSNGKIAGYSYNSTTSRWLNEEAMNRERNGRHSSMAINGNGSVVAFGSPFSFEKGEYKESLVDIVDFWGRLNPHVMTETEQNSLFGHQLDLTDDGLRLAISSPSHDDDLGMIQVFQRSNLEEESWTLSGNNIYGSANSKKIGLGFLQLNSSDGTRLFYTSENHDEANYYQNPFMLLRVYQLNSISQEWVELGNGIPCSFKGNKERIAVSADGNRIASSHYSTTKPGEVRIYEWNRDLGSKEWGWNQIGPEILSDAKGFGHSISMAGDGTLLAISSVNPICNAWNSFEEDSFGVNLTGDPFEVLCPTGSVQLYQYNITSSPPPRDYVPAFSRLPHKPGFNSDVITEEQKQVRDNTIIGLQVSLSGDGSILAVSGYDLGQSFGFVKVYNVTELFYVD